MSKTSPHPTTTLSKDSYAFSPGLAAKDEVGLNGAIVLSTIHALLQKDTPWKDGHYWIHHPIPKLHEQYFSWWKSRSTVEQAFNKLRESGLLIVGNYNEHPMDRTLWYTIDYAKLGALTKDLTPLQAPRKEKAAKGRVSDSGTGYKMTVGKKSPASSEVPGVGVSVEAQPDHATADERPSLPTATPTTTPEPDPVSAPAPRPERRPPTLELELLPSYQGQRRLYLVPDSPESGWLYWSNDGVPVARCTQGQYLRALERSPYGAKRRPHPHDPPNLDAYLGEHSVVLHVPRQPQIDATVQRLIAEHFSYVGQPGKWTRVKAAPSSLPQTMAQL